MFTLIFGIWIVFILTLFLALSIVAYIVLYPFDRSRRVVQELSRQLCFWFWKVPPYWKQEITGLENIEKGKKYVIVINHNSMADIISLYFLPLNFRWVSKREALAIPYIGIFLFLHGDILISRSKAAKAMRKVMVKGKMWLDRGACVAMFPEGTRSADGQIHRFKRGAFDLAKENGVDILPVVMEGTTNVMHHGLFNWRHTLKISVLPPVPAEKIATTPDTELVESVRNDMINRLEELRA